MLPSFVVLGLRSISWMAKQFIPTPRRWPESIISATSRQVRLPHAVYLYVISISVIVCQCVFNILYQARWVLSADDVLQEVGSSTGINYFNDLEEYLNILETGLRRKKKSVLNIIREWDKKIFPNSDSSLVVKEKKKDVDSGLKKAMDLLAADSEEEDNQMEDQDGNGEGVVANLD